ncbi:site-2 protease family protein [Candidatus Paracaedibacter symbiosus]|uniref:site-2 protease family protein n=1 Tax=Candidatus Paracaedibacter symbiosus TaxID=244582 RepID=UPI000509AB12|nr:site-2 protease family protein [Candidatus Paracaedibacter symbiosus]
MTDQHITIFATLIALIIGVTLHEAAHGYVARLFGDRTAEQYGRLTLNPIAHADLFGTLILPAIMFFSGSPLVFGYAKPVPVNENNLHPNRLGKFCVSFAGIAMNILLAIVAGLLTHINPTGETFGNDVLVALMRINLVLATFNLLPILPLDGGRMINTLLPRHLADVHSKSEPYGMLVILGLLLLPTLLQPLGIDFNPLMMIFGPIYNILASFVLFFIVW